MSGLTANLLATPFPSRRLAPYALAGAGGYAQNGTGSLRRGWTLGLGLSLPTATRSFFLESRLHTFRGEERDMIQRDVITTAWKAVWTPLSLGIQF